MDLVDSATVIPDREILIRLLQIGVVIEEYAEEKSAFILSVSLDDEFTQDILFDSLVESETHRNSLLELIRELDGSVDVDEVERLVEDAVRSSVHQPEGRDDALEEQLRSERLAYNYYNSLIDACRNSRENLDNEVIDNVLRILEDIREDELEDAQKLEKILENENNG